MDYRQYLCEYWDRISKGNEADYPNGVDPSNANSVEIKLSMKEGGETTQGQSYIVSNVFSLRNSVYTVTPEPSASPVPTSTP